jgi:hypothetical protein
MFLIAALLGDTGGPLFWPILSIFLGFVGLVVGTSVAHFKRPSIPHPPTLQPDVSLPTKSEQSAAPNRMG